MEPAQLLSKAPSLRPLKRRLVTSWGKAGVSFIYFGLKQTSKLRLRKDKPCADRLLAAFRG